jgi:5'-3' exonuclease
MKRILRKRKTKLLIDVSHLLYVSYFGLAERDRTKQDITGKVLGRILQLIEENHTTDLTFFWDSPKSLRKDRYSFYKEKRHKKPDPMIKYLHEARRDLKDILPAMGFNAHIEVEGYEADDTMCYVVMNNPTVDYIIVADDNDLIQILKYSNLKGLFSCRTNSLTTKKGAIDKYGIHPRDWHLYKCFGCKSDEVPGIPGVGSGYATKFIQGTLVEGSRQMNLIWEHRIDILLRNYWLVTLPLPGLKFHKDRFKVLPNSITKKKLKTVGVAYDIFFGKKWMTAILASRRNR